MTTVEEIIALGRNRLQYFLLFLIVSLSIAATAILISNPYVQLLSQVILSVSFYLVASLVKRRIRFRATAELFAAYAIFAAAAAIRTFAVGLVAIFLPADQLVIPFIDTFSIIGTVLVLTRLSGKSLGSIYLKKRNLRAGLVVGIIGFFLLYIGILVGFQVLYGNLHGISFVRLLGLSPVVLVLAFLNAPKEEIWFRSLFFGKSIPLFGKLGANLLSGPLFALAHLNAQYSQLGVAFQIGFLILVFGLGLFWGHLIQRTNSILASSLVHAGADVAIFLPILLSLL